VIKVKLTQEKKITETVAKPKVGAKISPAKKSISCIKGKAIKKVTGTSPKCPSGYKKR
jgi:hypothetical protein